MSAQATRLHVAGVIALICFAAGCTAKRASLPPTDSLALSYHEFDQTPAKGWRALSDRKQYREAAQLIEAYLTRHPGLPVKEFNERARQLYQSEGFKAEGLLREYYRGENGFDSVYVMSILESEYRDMERNR